MAPRKPKLDDDDDDASSLASEALKPKTVKAKVTKPKADKLKTEKAKIEKVKKEVAKKEKVDGEKPKKELVKKDAGKDKDGKEKVKAVNGEEAIQMILAYLKEQNRPYSATEVSANLHGKVTKTVADKLLKEMEQQGQITGKATKKDGGGQWVFWSIQDAADAASPEELAAMDAQVTVLKEAMPALKASHKSITAKLAALRAAPTTFELAAKVHNLKEENLAKAEKLKAFKDGSVKMVTKEELDLTEKELKYWYMKRKARKEGYANLEANLLEGMSKEDIMEKAGIEDDTM